MATLAFETHSAEETERIAAALAMSAVPPLVILLDGDLGAGKTTFARGFVHALNPSLVVQSPTFALARRYATTPPVNHVDLYRIDHGGLEELGIAEMLRDESAFSLVEWPREHVFSGPSFARIHIEDLGPETRRLTMELPDHVVDTARFESLARSNG